MEPLLQWGLEVIRSVQQMQSPLLNAFFLFVTGLGSGLFFLLVLPALFWCLDYRLGMRVAVVCALSAFCNSFLKVFFSQPRPFHLDPNLGLERAGGYGLPSGHAQGSLVFWGSIAHWVQKKWFWAMTVAFLILIGVSRIYLGVHFPTDVLAGWAVGIGLLRLYSIFYPRIEQWVTGRPLGLQVLLVLGVPPGMLLIQCSRITVFQSGLLLGIGAGAIVHARCVSYSTRCTKAEAALRYAIGGSILVASLTLLRGIYPSPETASFLVTGFFHSAINGIWISLGAPWLFRLLKL